MDFILEDSYFTLADSDFTLANSDFTLAASDFTLADSDFILEDSDFTLADSDFTLANSDFTLEDSDWIWSGFGQRVLQCERKGIGFVLNSNPSNRGGLRNDSHWTRLSVNAIRLNLDWRSSGCYGEITVRCLFYNVFPKMMNAHMAF